MEEEQTYLELYLDQCVAQVSPEAAATVPRGQRALLPSVPRPEPWGLCLLYLVRNS